MQAIISTAGIYVQQYLLHREFWLGLMIGKVLPIIVPLLVWMELYRSTGLLEIEGWSQGEMMSYYLIVFVIAAFTRIDFHRDLSQMVHLGKLNEWLLRPLSFFEMAAGMILGRIVVLLVPSLFTALFCLLFFQELRSHMTFEAVTSMMALLPFAIVLLAALSVTIGMLAFWLIQTEGTFALMMMLFEFFGGALLPLSLLPLWLQKVSTILPLRFAIYLPAQYILGERGVGLATIILGQLAWIVGLLTLAWWLCHRGLRRYDAIGG